MSDLSRFVYGTRDDMTEPGNDWGRGFLTATGFHYMNTNRDVRDIERELADDQRQLVEDRESSIRGDLENIDQGFKDPRIQERLRTIEGQAIKSGNQAADARYGAQRATSRQKMGSRGLLGSSIAQQAQSADLSDLVGDRLRVASLAADQSRRLRNRIEEQRQNRRQAVVQGRVGSGENLGLLSMQRGRLASDQALATDRMQHRVGGAVGNYIDRVSDDDADDIEEGNR